MNQWPIAVRSATDPPGVMLDSIEPAPHSLILVQGVFGGRIGSAQKWANGPLGSWEPDPAGHFIHPTRPVFRFVNYSLGMNTPAKVTVMSVQAWFGAAADGRDLFELTDGVRALHRTIRRLFDNKALLLATPLATGRELWQRTIPRGTEFPSLSPELGELIRSTTQQGRVELLPPATPTVPFLCELDARLAYGALCNELPTGVLEHDDRPWHPDDAYQRARYRVTVTVPDDWQHVGLLGVRRRGWEYPAAPGETFETWADNVELHLAHKMGWTFHAHERIVFDKGRPLDRWARHLTTGATTATDPLVRAGLRAILLNTIGGFTAKPRMVTKSAPDDGATSFPARARHARIVDGHLVWMEPGPDRAPWMHMPHWPATIWARQRVRLLTGPGGAGALHLDPEHVVAFRTDALWLTVNPPWQDDGKAGQYRLKTNVPGPRPWPTTQQELLNR